MIIDSEWNSEECIGFIMICILFNFHLHDFDQDDCSDIYNPVNFLIGHFIYILFGTLRGAYFEFLKSFPNNRGKPSKNGENYLVAILLVVVTRNIYWVLIYCLLYIIRIQDYYFLGFFFLLFYINIYVYIICIFI